MAKGKTYCLGDCHGGYRALVQVLERSEFNKKTDQLIILGDVVDGWPQTVETINELLTIKNIIPIMGNHCLDIETEVFTEDGWKKYDEILKTDKVFGINTSNNFIEWQNINDILIKQSDHLNYVQSSNIDFAMTDEHRILIESEKEYYEYHLLKDVKNSHERYKIPLSGKTNFSDYPILDNEIKLVAWILTDGYMHKMHNCINIYQSKEENIEHIKQLLNSLNISFTHHIRKRTSKSILGKKVKTQKIPHVYCIHAKDAILIKQNLITSKINVPKWCYNLSQRQLQIFIQEIIRGDGSKFNRNTEMYILYGKYTFLSEMQAICNLAGYSANLTCSNRGDFRLNISTKSTFTLRSDTHKFTREIGNFTVWCLSVPLTNFLVRRNGKSYFTGNCFWAYNWMRYGWAPPIWLMQGGQATYDSYKSKENSDALRDRHKFKYFDKCHGYYVDEQRNAFVHGGFTHMEGLGNDTLETYMWDRSLWDKAKSAKDVQLNLTKKYNKVFIGHTSLGLDSLPLKRGGNVWNLDTGGGFENKLTIMDINTEEYWQSDNVNELYPEISEIRRFKIKRKDEVQNLETGEKV